MSSSSAARLDVLERQVAELRAAVVAGTRSGASGARDRFDETLVHVLADASRGAPFTTSALWRRRAVDTELAAAILNCDIDNPKQVGKLLRRLVGHDVGGAVIQRVGTTRAGALWRVCVSG